MKESNLKGNSKDIVAENIQQLKELFPTVFAEGSIDFDKLKAVLGEYVDDDEERYNFTWWGKSQALRLAQTPSTGTLRPCPEESKDWDTTQNLYIEGDNLEVLKLLQKTYHNKVKMIYIDPPYNTGNDFVYPDDYRDNLQNYLEITEQVSSEGRRTSTNAETSGRYHTNWLNMMYPRLRLARNLLTASGVILINIDEHEVTNLQKLMQEIYGEDNDLGVIIWDKRNPKGDAKGISVQHESILVYAKNRAELLGNENIVRSKPNAVAILKKASAYFKKIGAGYSLDDANSDFSTWLRSQNNFSGGEKAYNQIDKAGNVFQSVSMAWPNKKKAPKDYFIPLVTLLQKGC